MNALWLLIDGFITAPFFLLGYAFSAIVNTLKHGYYSYEINYKKAKRGAP